MYYEALCISAQLLQSDDWFDVHIAAGVISDVYFSLSLLCVSV